jgi:uncharacterized membrane protein
MGLTDVTEHVAEVFDVVGAGVLVVGAVWSLVMAVRVWRTEGGGRAYQTARTSFGSALLLGLEILVAADLVRTIVTPTLEEVTVLAIIVAIRTFLSFSLQVEVDGRLPWQRGAPPTGPGRQT